MEPLFAVDGGSDAPDAAFAAAMTSAFRSSFAINLCLHPPSQRQRAKCLQKPWSRLHLDPPSRSLLERRDAIAKEAARFIPSALTALAVGGSGRALG